MILSKRQQQERDERGKGHYLDDVMWMSGDEPKGLHVPDAIRCCLWQTSINQSLRTGFIDIQGNEFTHYSEREHRKGDEKLVWENYIQGILLPVAFLVTRTLLILPPIHLLCVFL